jgi:hypothetical protein
MPAMVVPGRHVAVRVGTADRLPQFRSPLRFKFRRLPSLTCNQAVGGQGSLYSAIIGSGGLEQ